MLHNDNTYYNEEFNEMIDNIYTYLLILKDSRKNLEEKPEYDTMEISHLPNLIDYIQKLFIYLLLNLLMIIYFHFCQIMLI
jgi:hypothetical protein